VAVTARTLSSSRGSTAPGSNCSGPNCPWSQLLGPRPLLIVDGAVVLASMTTRYALERGDRSPVSLLAFGCGSSASYGFLP